MPTSAPRVCACGRIVPYGTTCPCKPKRGAAKAYDAMRGSARQRGYDTAWDRLREAHLSDHPLCAHCLEEEIVEVADDVDHIVPISVAPGRRLDPTNLQSLCRRHHNVKTAAERASTQRGG